MHELEGEHMREFEGEHMHELASHLSVSCFLWHSAVFVLTVKNAFDKTVTKCRCDARTEKPVPSCKV